MNKMICAVVPALFLITLVACGGSAPQDPVAEAPAEAEAPAPEAEAAEPAKAEIGGVLNVDEQGRALRGFDAVAYHQEGAAVAGVDEFSHVWQDATWLFANAENRDAFAAAPESFAPMNGGYCTFGVVLRKKLDVDPQRFLVQNDDLYLFLNAEVQEKFSSDLEGNLSLVTSHWPDIAEKHPEELAADAG
ncbi:MAG: YHS domain-containing (seleno)protein [Acidobacteriota bacterium]